MKISIFWRFHFLCGLIYLKHAVLNQSFAQSTWHKENMMTNLTKFIKIKKLNSWKGKNVNRYRSFRSNSTRKRSRSRSKSSVSPKRHKSRETDKEDTAKTRDSSKKRESSPRKGETTPPRVEGCLPTLRIPPHIRSAALSFYEIVKIIECKNFLGNLYSISA